MLGAVVQPLIRCNRNCIRMDSELIQELKTALRPGVRQT
jgi:hypothetical protein